MPVCGGDGGTDYPVARNNIGIILGIANVVITNTDFIYHHPAIFDVTNGSALVMTDYFKDMFSVADTQLYKRLCQSVGLSVRASVGP